MNSKNIAAALAVIALAITLGGCATMKMQPAPNQERIALAAEDVAIILSNIGFSDKEIVKRGRDFRNQLAQHGAVSLRRGGTTVATLAVRGTLIHVTSLSAGSFVYDPATKTLR